jgi:hypothetical protein
MRSFFSNFNSRLLVIHFIAFCLFAWAFQTLGFLHDYNFLFLASEHITRLNFPQRFDDDMEVIEQVANIGLLIAYIISWSLSNKRNWHWVNSVTIFILAFLLKNFILRVYIDRAFLVRGGPLRLSGYWGHLLTGVILVVIGLALFYSRRIIAYINRGNKTEKKTGPVSKKPVPAKKR